MPSAHITASFLFINRSSKILRRNRLPAKFSAMPPGLTQGDVISTSRRTCAAPARCLPLLFLRTTLLSGRTCPKLKIKFWKRAARQGLVGGRRHFGGHYRLCRLAFAVGLSCQKMRAETLADPVRHPDQSGTSSHHWQPRPVPKISG